MFTNMLGVLAEYERELIRERTVAGLQEAKRRGVKLGRRPVKFDVARAREMRAAGLSYAAVAHELGVGTGGSRTSSPARPGLAAEVSRFDELRWAGLGMNHFANSIVTVPGWPRYRRRAKDITLAKGNCAEPIPNQARMV